MERNTILAIFLCFLVVVGFQFFNAGQLKKRKELAEKLSPTSTLGATTTGSIAAAGASPAAAAASPSVPPAVTPEAPEPVVATPALPAAEVKPLTLENEKLRLVFSTEGAVMTRAVLLEYQDYRASREAQAEAPPLDLLDAFQEGAHALAIQIGDSGDALTKAVWHAEQAGQSIRFFTRYEDLRVEKTVTLPEEGYELGVIVTLENLGTKKRKVAYRVAGATAIRLEEPTSREFPYMMGVAGLTGDNGVELETETAADLPLPGEEGEDPVEHGNTVFGGSVSKYFAMALIPGEGVKDPVLILERTEGKVSGARKPLDGQNAIASYQVEDLKLPLGFAETHHYGFFVGPRAEDVLEEYKAQGLNKLFDLSSRVPLAETLSYVFQWLFRKLSGLFGSLGLAIILLTLMVRGALHPLSSKSQRSTHKMQKLQPKVKEIQAKFEGKKSRESMQKMQMEIAELYKKHNVSPIMGCLPMLLQLPVFIGLYNLLAYSIELRQKSFLWISDLSKPDRTLDFGMSLPWPIEGYLNILPLFMAVTMFLQQQMAPKAADPQAQQQQKMMRMIAVIFPVMFYTIPSGLVLYFFISSLVGMGETQLIRRQLAAEDEGNATEIAAAKA